MKKKSLHVPYLYGQMPHLLFSANSQTSIVLYECDLIPDKYPRTLVSLTRYLLSKGFTSVNYCEFGQN